MRISKLNENQRLNRRRIRNGNSREIEIAKPRKRNNKKGRTSFQCYGCNYESTRLFNVQRHEERIHRKQKLRICCGQSFFNKGNYYIHCEQVHPESRLHSVMSKYKYKITNKSKAQNVDLCKSQSTARGVQLARRKSERIRNQRKHKSKLSVKYLMTYRECDTEDIPLIRFVKDRRLKSRLRRVPAKKIKTEIDTKTREESKQTVKFEFSSEQNMQESSRTVQIDFPWKQKIEEEAPKDDDANSHLKVSEQPFVELPTKKLLLHRFRSSTEHSFEMHLQDSNNNNPEQTNSAKKPVKESVSPLQNRAKNFKRSRANKENIPMLPFNMQKMSIKLDAELTGPMVTELHRDFLHLIDFDKYKIL